jgi:prepilin-type N-terminal cleavage/methylation domain-containing protein
MKRKAFTIIELLVVVSIIALLVGILLPAIGRARDQAKLTFSFANLKNLGVAHASYAAEWNDRQLTLIDDNLGRYGSSSAQAFSAYNQAGMAGGDPEQGSHPPLILGWGYLRNSPQNIGQYVYFAYRVGGNDANNGLLVPIRFGPPSFGIYFGAFRIPNAYQFNQYVSGKFYDKVFYAPKDDIAWNTVESNDCFNAPDEFADCIPPVPGMGDAPAWSSYISSPAAMFNPYVMQRQNPDQPGSGFRFPWTDGGPAAFRSPAMSQAAYPSLKTHMLEHHWLQNRKQDCNPNYDVSAYGNCEPYYFNHSWDSSPVTLFYDGHVESVGTRKAQRQDQRILEQNGYGLWHRGTPWGENGYLHVYGYETQANTSFHILTTDGLRGRDVVAD